MIKKHTQLTSCYLPPASCLLPLASRLLSLASRLLSPAFCLLLFLLPLPLLSQLFYSGTVNPYGMYRISDGSEISLPLRLAELELGYTYGDFDLKTNSVVESRFSNGEKSVELREFYLVWYPSFGEVKLGKQIHAWGAADGNNPTDNLNAYDFYYLFLPGADRKIGSLSASVNAYFGDWQIEAVVIPEHQGDRLPFDEPDFPIVPIHPTKDQMVEVDDPLEFGVRVQTSFLESDISMSYFKGHDRGFSLLGMIFPYASPMPEMKFGYRSTEMIGVDGVTFIGDITLRGEAAFFTTINNVDFSVQEKFPLDAKYLQYVFQCEYTGIYDIQFIGQFIGSKILELDGETVIFPTFKRVTLKEEDFRPGMGTPFAMFADKALLLSATGNLMDDRLELRGNMFTDLEDVGSGTMVGLSVDYSPIENWSIEFSTSKFIGNDDPENVFNQLEVFSHIRIGLKYSF